MKVKFHCWTNGSGYWTSVSKKTEVITLELTLAKKLGELRAYFSKDWNVKIDGLIYTDKSWIQDLRLNLFYLGFSMEAIQNIDYSEQGMQGHDYVSLDVGVSFMREYLKQVTFNE